MKIMAMKEVTIPVAGNDYKIKIGDKLECNFVDNIATIFFDKGTKKEAIALFHKKDVLKNFMITS
jgi:hypothetical protein